MPKTNKAAFVIYEDSLPLGELVDWFETEHVKAAVSPVHDSDVWTKASINKWLKSQKRIHDLPYIDPSEDSFSYWGYDASVESGSLHTAGKVQHTVNVPKPGDLKKPHRHCMVKFDYSLTFESMRNKLAGIHVSYFEDVQSESAYLRYFCHLDSPDKTRYNIADVMGFGGYDLAPLYQQSRADKASVEREVMSIISKPEIRTWSALVDVVFESGDYELWAEVKGSSGFWLNYMKDKTFVSVKKR